MDPNLAESNGYFNAGPPLLQGPIDDFLSSVVSGDIKLLYRQDPGTERKVRNIVNSFRYGVQTPVDGYLRISFGSFPSGYRFPLSRHDVDVEIGRRRVAGNLDDVGGAVRSGRD